MKKKGTELSFFSVCLLLITLSLAGCKQANQGAEKKWGLAYDSLMMDRSVHLFGDTAKPSCHLVLNLTYVSQANDTKFKDSLNHYLLGFSLGDKFINKEPREALENFATNYANAYRNDLEPLYRKEEELNDGREMGAWYNYYKKIESRIQRCQGILLTYRNRYEEFTGGAHGMYATTFLHIDLRTLTPVTLHELFADEATDELTELLWQQLMADNQVSTKEELYDLGYASTGDLLPINNFYLDDKGITFYYNVYDIAPYAMGPITITLSRDKVAHLIGDASLWGDL